MWGVSGCRVCLVGCEILSTSESKLISILDTNSLVRSLGSGFWR
jgi:hypothetical protein